MSNKSDFLAKFNCSSCEGATMEVYRSNDMIAFAGLSKKVYQTKIFFIFFRSHYLFFFFFFFFCFVLFY